MAIFYEEMQFERSRQPQSTKHYQASRQGKMHRLALGYALGRWIKYACVFSIAAATAASLSAFAAESTTKPWLREDAIIIMDPYEENDPAINWKMAASDPRLKAVIHRASIGMKADNAFITIAEIASTHGLKLGAYHLGLRGDPIAQADIFLSQVRKTSATFLALDIEGIGGNNMPLVDAERFIRYIHEKTGRYPALYGTLSVAKAISENYSGNSAFSKTPLWLASPRATLPAIPTNIWDRITLWQFSSEINCPKKVREKGKDSLCEPYRPYAVPGTRYDLDLNVLMGDKSLLDKLFAVVPAE
ncbi:glycoside hydrolase family 25 protein [Ralstonia pseudosolanacearum]